MTNLWNTHPKNYGAGSRQWYVIKEPASIYFHSLAAYAATVTPSLESTPSMFADNASVREPETSVSRRYVSTRHLSLHLFSRLDK